MDQLSFLSPYPDGPALGRTDTSRAAAEKIAPVHLTLRERVILAVKAAGQHGLTADECADVLAVKPTSTRPRCTEAARIDPPLIHDSGLRRSNDDGNMQIVWRWGAR